MAGNKIGATPEFTTDEVVTEETVESAVPTPEVTEAPVETPEPAPTEGPETPAEPPPAPVQPAPETAAIENQLKGLMAEKEKLLDEVKALRGTRREIKQEQIARVEQKIDDLNDLNPADVSVVDRILRGKGYVTKDEAQQMFYNSVKQEQLDRFLEKYPEYKPENDPNDLHWNSFQRELAYYVMPKDPHKIGEILERAQKALRPPSTGTTQVKRQQVAVAGHGAGGTQRSPTPTPKKSLSDFQRTELLRGGWTEEEIKRMEQQ